MALNSLTQKILVLSPNSGISGDMLVAGLAQMASIKQSDLDLYLERLNLQPLIGQVKLVPRVHNSIQGQGLALELPPENEHRHLADIINFFDRADLTPRAKKLATDAFTLLAQAEAFVHAQDISEVHFHEVGALDSILDMGLASVFFDLINPDLFVCGPLPICDGAIKAAHGLMPSPAPAVSYLLNGVLIKGLDSTGETVTPTAISLLKTFGAVFAAWPEMVWQDQCLVYGSRILPNVPNGALWAWGLGPKA
jgi:uncharacterized protein (DUF111 family)